MPSSEANADGASAKATTYSLYALAVLTAANLFNYLDRYIVSILAQSIKTDLRLDDAQLGFLMGTAFAIFYAMVGIAMGRVADRVSRTKLMAAGLALWSTMTAFGGLATNYAMLAAARIGVGVGEATATPSSHSLLSQYFPPRNRAMALAVYLCGTFLGSSLALIGGGYIVDHWQTGMCSTMPFAGACDLAAWKAAFMIVGLPGIPLALVVLSLREPPREAAGASFATIMREFGSALPPFTLATIHQVGGRGALRDNLSLAAGLIAGAALIIRFTGDFAQWVSIAIGAYSIATWAEVMKYRDPPLHRLTFGDPVFFPAILGAGTIACIGGAASFWAAPYAMRTFAMSSSEAGLNLGIFGSLAAVAGVLIGGFVTDRWKRRDVRAPLWVAMISVLSGLPAMALLLLASDKQTFIFGYFLYSVLTSMWSGGFAALAQDLVLPRMRGAAASAFSLLGIVVASAAGPYWAGKISQVSGSLVTGLFSVQLLVPVAIGLLWFAAHKLARQTFADRVARAQEAGESVSDPTVS